MNQARTIPKISKAATYAARRLLDSEIPMPEAPDHESVRAIGVTSDNPRQAVRSFAERQFDHAVSGHKSAVEKTRKMLRREDERLEKRYRVLNQAIDETPRNDIDYKKSRKMPFRERLALFVQVIMLLAILGASVATIKAIALDTGIVQSAAQAIAFGLVPAVGAFILAHFVVTITIQSSYRFWKRAINISAVLLLWPWTFLFVTVFGTGATMGIDEMIAQMGSGFGEPITPGGSLMERAFFVGAILFEVTAGATFKISIDQILRRSERAIPERNAFFSDREQELASIVDEWSEVQDADASLEGRLEEIDAGRKAFADEVLALLMLSPLVKKAETRSRTQHQPKPDRMLFGDNMNTNGRNQS